MVLMEELVEALVCKPWCRLISGRRFHRRFREFHRTPPMLGYLCNLSPSKSRGNASGVGACDHLDCRDKPFLVVFAGSAGTEEISMCIYSSETGSCNEPTFAAPKPEYGVTDNEPTALVGNTLYFMADMGFSILRYDLVTRESSMVENVAVKCMEYSTTMPMAIEDSGMAIGVKNNSRLFLRSMEVSAKGDISWKKIRVIELNEVFPVKFRPVGADYCAFLPGFGILVAASQRLFSIDLKSDKVQVVSEGPVMRIIVHYMSFYIPALGSFAAVEGPGADAASSP